MPPGPSRQGPFAVLRGLMRQRPASERCELCGAGLAAGHAHLMEPAARRLLCCCDPCALLFSDRRDGRYRRVPRRAEFLPDFRLTDEQWDGLHLPINLAFFVRSTPAGGVVALYPSPAGVTESSGAGGSGASAGVGHGSAPSGLASRCRHHAASSSNAVTSMVTDPTAAAPPPA